MVQTQTMNHHLGAAYYCQTVAGDYLLDLEEWGGIVGREDDDDDDDSLTTPKDEFVQEHPSDDPAEMAEQDEDDDETVRFYDTIQSSSPQTTIPQSLDWHHFYCRRIQPSDRQIIQELHETWFPVQYQSEFYDDLCAHQTMCGSGEPLYTNVICCQDTIVACIVAALVPAHRLNATTRQLLLPQPQQHSQACYIMTLGTRREYRHFGLATRLVEQCYQELVLSEPKCGALYLHVIISNQTAIRFYERLQFWRVTEIPEYYHIDQTYHNCYLYAKYFHGK